MVKKGNEKCSGKALHPFGGIVFRSKAPLAFFIGLFALTLAYRIQLSLGLFRSPVRPFDFQPTTHPLWFTLSYFPYDAALILLLSLLSWLFSHLRILLDQSKMLPWFKILGLLLLHIALFILTLVHGIHGRLLFDTQTGLDLFAIVEGGSNISFLEVIKVIEIRDYLFLLLPFGLFWLMMLSARSLRIWTVKVSIALVVLLLLIPLFAPREKPASVPIEIRLNPTLFLLSDLARNAFHKSVATSEGGVEKGQSVAGHGSLPYAAPHGGGGTFLPPRSDHPWNIVFFVMESVGTRYIFDTSQGRRMPMPFLHSLSRESWYLKRHFTTSNVSTKALFSILSGHYDLFGRQDFGTRPDAVIPSLYHFLDKSYDSFLVTPSSLGWYFPAAFVRNGGLREIYSYENLNFKIKEDLNALGRYIARDEVQTVDFFVQRIRKAKEPFVGTYISFAAHFPYFDYGENYRISKEDGRLISRYYNNLNLLDRMIRKVYESLKEQGLLNHTLLVIVGDHGQAFGQHYPNNFMHYRYSYNENLETPAFLYQPAVFKPKTFERPTSHVDLLPTLLDAMRIPYDPAWFDGESLFRDPTSRRYLFFYGYEGSISSLSANLTKLQRSFKENRCWAFDLKLDPDEIRPLDCTRYEVQNEDLREFVHSHDFNLEKYNEALRSRRGEAGVQLPDPLR
jgi:hypothetical protein